MAVREAIDLADVRHEWANLYEAYAEVPHVTVQTVLRSEAPAQDVHQQIFRSVYGHIPRGRPTSTPAEFISIIAHGEAVRRLRRVDREAALDDELAAMGGDGDVLTAATLWCTAAQSLYPLRRELLDLRDWRDIGTEVARKLGLTIDATQEQVARWGRLAAEYPRESDIAVFPRVAMRVLTSSVSPHVASMASGCNRARRRDWRGPGLPLVGDSQRGHGVIR